MANQLSHLLKQWYPQRDTLEWVLGTVYKTEGPSYRKAGAMMLFNSLGQSFGMLSGGCLESDIQTHARRIMQGGQALTLRYDGSDEDDLSFQLGIGCGGVVYILLQAVTAENQYLDLVALLHALEARQGGFYQQWVPRHSGSTRGQFFRSAPEAQPPGLHADKNGYWLLTEIRPDPHLLVVGGGIDARPLVKLAHDLGWYVSLWDPRPANARREFFPQADALLSGPAEQLGKYASKQRVNAAVMMSHNIDLDAQALQQLHDKNLSYWGLLGPQNRRQKVLKQAGLQDAELSPPLAGPMGLNIGGELPESIALSILAECHARLQGRDGRSFSGVLNT